jgi:putative membrane protein
MPTFANELRILILSLVYAIVGIGLLYAGYRVFDMLTPTNLQHKIFEEGNVAVSVLTGFFILALAVVIAAAMGGA